MAFVSLLAPTTASATTVPTSYVEAEQLVVTAVGLATTETVNVQVVGSQGAANLYGAAAAPFQYQLTATAQALVVPGGYILQFAKSATAAAVGVEVHIKPRIGGGAS